MANNKELTQLMLDAYKPSGERIGAGEFRPYGDGLDLPNGLRIQAYISEPAKESVFGVAGTNDLSDLAPDIDFVTGGYHDQFKEAVKYSNDVKNEIESIYGKDEFSFSCTGHSLGGGTCQVIANTFGWGGATYDAPAASGVIADPAYQQHLTELGVTASGPGDLVNYTESGSLVSSVPGRSYIGQEIGLELTGDMQQVIGAGLMFQPNPVGKVIGGIVLADDQWGSDGQHNAEKFADYFSVPQNPNEIDGYFYVGGTYDGWYNTKPGSYIGQNDWTGRASPDKEASLFALKDRLEQHNESLVEQTPAISTDYSQPLGDEPLNEWISAPNTPSRYIWVSDDDGTLTKVVDTGDGRIVETQYNATGEMDFLKLHNTTTGESYTTYDSRPMVGFADDPYNVLDPQGDGIGVWDGSWETFDSADFDTLTATTVSSNYSDNSLNDSWCAVENVGYDYSGMNATDSSYDSSGSGWNDWSGTTSADTYFDFGYSPNEFSFENTGAICGPDYDLSTSWSTANQESSYELGDYFDGTADALEGGVQGINLYGYYEIGGNYQTAQPLLDPETYINRMSMVDAGDWQSLSEVATPSSSSYGTASTLATVSPVLDYGSKAFDVANVAYDGYYAYQTSNGDVKYTAAYTAASATWNIGGGEAAIVGGCAAAVWLAGAGCVPGAAIGYLAHMGADYVWGDDIKAGLADAYMGDGGDTDLLGITVPTIPGESQEGSIAGPRSSIEPGMVQAEDGSWTKYTEVLGDGSALEIIQVGDQIINRHISADGQLLEQHSGTIASDSSPDGAQVDGVVPSIDGSDTPPVTTQPQASNTSSNDFHDWVAENHPEQLANMGSDGEFLYRTADAGGYATDGQSSYASAQSDYNSLREQYMAENGGGVDAIDNGWDDATDNFDADTLDFIAEAEAEFQAEAEAEAAAEAAAQKQQAAIQANANAFNSVLVFQQALQGDNDFAKVTATVSLVNSMKQAEWFGMSSSADGWTEAGKELGFVSAGINFFDALESGDNLSILRSGASLGAQVASMSTSAGAKVVGQALGKVAGVIGIAQSLEAGDELGAAIGVITMINPALGAVLSLARTVFSMMEGEPPPPTANLTMEYDAATGEFNETEAESHDGGSLETLRALADGIDGVLQNLIATTGGQLLPPEDLKLELVQSDNRLYINGERYSFEQANQAVGKTAIQILQQQIQIEGGDPLIARALYNSEAESLEELQADLQASAGYRQYLQGSVILDADGNPLSEEGMEQYREDVAALQAGDMSIDDFNSLYSAISQREYVDNLFAELPDSLDLNALLSDKYDLLEKIEQLEGGIKSLNSEVDWLQATLEQAEGWRDDPTAAEGIDTTQLTNLGLSDAELKQLASGTFDETLLDKLEAGIREQLAKSEQRLVENQSELELARADLATLEQTLDEGQPETYLRQLDEQQLLQNRLADGEEQIAELELSLEEQRAELEYIQTRLSSAGADAQIIELEQTPAVEGLRIDPEYMRQTTLTRAEVEQRIEALHDAIAEKEAELESLQQQQAQWQTEWDELTATINESLETWPTLAEAAEWYQTLEQAQLLQLDEPHWTDNVTRLNSLINDTDDFSLGGVELSDLEMELKDGVLILHVHDKQDPDKPAQELVIEDWEQWDHDKSHIRLPDGSHLNIQGLLDAYGVVDGEGPVDLGEAAAALFDGVEGIETPEVGQARAGTALDDTLSAVNGQAWLDGRDGNDTLRGSAEDDYLRGGSGADILRGGQGSDTVLYDDAESGIYVDLEQGGGRGSTAEGDTYEGIENVLGSSYDDVLIGDANANRLDGSAGNDVLLGGAGDDTLIGGEGNDALVGGEGADHLVGGAGIDTADYSSSAEAVAVDLGKGTGHGGDAEGDTLDSIENLKGSMHDDYLVGDAGDNTIDGAVGDDHMAGGAGDDTMFGGAGRDVVDGGAGNDMLDGGSGDDVLTGGDGDDVLHGGSGDNLLLGGDGDDIALFDGNIGDYDLSVRNGTLRVEALDGSSRDILDGVEQIAFSSHLYDVQRLMDLLQAQTVIDDEGEVSERRERERDTAGQAAAIALASAYGITATAQTEESSAEELNWFGVNPNATESGGENSGSENSNTQPASTQVNPDTVFTQPLITNAVDGGAIGTVNDSGNVSPQGVSVGGNGATSTEYNAPAVPGASAGETIPFLFPSGDGAQDASSQGDESSSVDETGTASSIQTNDSGSRCGSGDDLPPPPNAPVVEAATVTTLEDQSVLLSIDVVNPNADAALAIAVTGVPTGGYLSAGEEIAPGEWRLSTADLDGLRFIPPQNSDVDVTLTVFAVAYDQYGQANQSALEQMVEIVAVADAPGIGVADVVGNEDSVIALNLDSYYPDSDGSELHRVELVGIPAGAVLSAGTMDASGVWHLAPDQLAGLTLTPSLNDGNDFTVTMRGIAEETENGDVAVTEATFNVTVNAVADAPDLSVVDMVAGEDDITPVELFPQLVDTDGSETLSILIEGVPVGAVLSHGTELSPGVWELTPADAALVVMTPPADSDEDFQLRVTATSTEGENGDQAHTVRTLNVTLNAVSDGAIVSVAPAEGDQNQFIDLDISASLNDTDGSESLVIEIRNVPVGATLSAGTNLGNGTWSLTPAQLTGLQILPPLDSTETIYLSVVAISTEAENGDSVETTYTAEVVVNAVANPAGLTVLPAFGDEDTAIDLTINVDTSSLDSNQVVHVEVSGLPEGATLSAGSESAGVWTLSLDELAGLTLNPAPDSDEDFTLDVAAVTQVVDDPSKTTSVSASAPVTVYAVADGVDLAAGDVTGNEDSLIALDVAGQLRDLDGSEDTVVTISGLPSGSVLSAGTVVAAGVWQLSVSQLDGLMFKPPADADGTYTLTVEAYSREAANGDTSQVITTNFNVTVDAVADAPGLTASVGVAEQGTPVVLDIGAWLNDTDSSESLLIEIEGLPGGAALSAGTSSRGVWQLTPAELTGLTLDAGQNSQNFTLTVRAISSEGGNSNTSTQWLDVSYGDMGAPTLSVAVSGVSSATADNDLLQGFANADTLYGGGGEDRVYGGGGDDILYGDDTAAMTVVALDIQAALQTSDGSEALVLVIDNLPNGASLSAGTQSLDGNGNPIPGSWTLTESDLPGLTLSTPANGNNFTLNVSAVAVNLSTQGTLTSVGQVNVVLPDIGSGDYLDGGVGDDTLYGEDGDDLLRGGVGSDVLYGGAGDDTLVIDADDWNGNIDGGSGTDTVVIDDDRDVAFYAAVSAVENIYGGRGNDSLYGDSRNNILYGGGGRDVLSGGGGNDEIHADAADVAMGSNFVNGGSGIDTLFFEGSTGVNFDVNGRDFEHIHGSSGDDLFGYDASSAVITLDGGAGIDTVDYSSASGAVTVNLGTGSATGADISSIENVIGTDFNDTLTGDSGENRLTGGLGNDTLNGGGGVDTAVYAGSFLDYYDGHSTFNIVDNGTFWSVKSPDGSVDTLRNIEQLYFEADDRYVYLDGRNNRPDAVDDVLSATEDVTATYTAADLLANDFDFDGDSFTLVDVNVASALNGTVVWNDVNKTISFTPKENYNSSSNAYDTGGTLYRDEADFGFEYTIEDANGERHTAWASIVVDAVNDAPEIVSCTSNRGSGHSVVVTGNVIVMDVDSDPGSFTYSTSNLAINGTYSGVIKKFGNAPEITTVTTNTGGMILTGNYTLSAMGDVDFLPPVLSDVTDPKVAINTVDISFVYTGFQSPIAYHYHVWEKTAKFNITVSDGPVSDTFYNVGNNYENIWWEPLVLDMDGDGIELVGIEAGVTYDTDGDGIGEVTGWVAPDDAMLVYDMGHDGDISDVNELMFSETAIEARNELDVLRILYDTNQDGRFNAADDAWNDFALWQDKNLNGKADEGELTYMVDSTIDGINLTGQAVDIEESGNLITELTDYTRTDGQTGELGVVYFELLQSSDSSDPSVAADLALLQDNAVANDTTVDTQNTGVTTTDSTAALQQQAEVLASMLASDALVSVGSDTIVLPSEMGAGVVVIDNQWDELNVG